MTNLWFFESEIQMSLSDIALCSRALIRIGAAPIASFDGGTAASEIAGALYAPIRDALLSSYGWSFATGQVALAALAAPPAADYGLAYQLPDDFLRALSAGTGGKGRGLEFRIASGNLQTDASAVLLTYIFRPDESEFPPYFDFVLIARLSAEFCIPVTENTARANSLYQLAELEFARAKQIDSQQDTPARIDDFSLINARLS
jgi:hypothetical protein